MSAFTVDGYRVLLFDCSADSLSMTAVASETGETFRTEQWQLHKIKPSTVEAAFRRESPHLKCTRALTQTASRGRKEAYC